MSIDALEATSGGQPAPAAGISPEQLHIRKLTDNDQATDVAISPDGRYVAFVRGERESQSLWLRQIDTRTDVEILPSQGVGLSSLTFSPDGSLIYFVKHHADDPFAGSLYSMSMLGGAARKVIDDIKSPISFSPDGKRFVYESCWSDGVQLRIARVDRDDERQLAAIRKAECVVFQPGPSWSPDGRTIVAPVFLCTNQQWILASVSADDGTVRELFSGAYRIGRPVWLAGGHALLVPHAEEMFREFQLWTVTFPGGEVRRLSDDLTSYGRAARCHARRPYRRLYRLHAHLEHLGRARRGSDAGAPGVQWVAGVQGGGARQRPDSRSGLRGQALDAWTADGSQRTPFSSLRDVNIVRAVRQRRRGRGGHLSDHGDVLSRRRGRFTCNPPDRGSCLRAAGLLGQWRLPLLREPGPRLPDSAGGRGPTARWAITSSALSLPLGVSPDGTRLACLHRVHGAGSSEGWKVAVVRTDNGSPIASWPVRLPPTILRRIPMVPPGPGLAVPEVRRRWVQRVGAADGRRQREAADQIHVRENLQF